MSISTQSRAFLRDCGKGMWRLPEQAAWWPRVQFPGAGPQVLRLAVPKQHLGKRAGPAVSQKAQHRVGLDPLGHPPGASGFMYKSIAPKGWGKASASYWLSNRGSRKLRTY